MEIRAGAERAKEVLAGERQTLWSVLKWSISQQFDYWLQLCYPSQVKDAAQLLDQVLWDIMEGAAGTHVPREDQGMGWECVLDPPIDYLRGRSFQEWVVRQPVKMGGMGLRGLVDVSPAAFIGAVEQSVTSFAGERGICWHMWWVGLIVMVDLPNPTLGGELCSSLGVELAKSTNRHGMGCK